VLAHALILILLTGSRRPPTVRARRERVRGVRVKLKYLAPVTILDVAGPITIWDAAMIQAGDIPRFCTNPGPVVHGMHAAARVHRFPQEARYPPCQIAKASSIVNPRRVVRTRTTPVRLLAIKTGRDARPS